MDLRSFNPFSWRNGVSLSQLPTRLNLDHDSETPDSGDELQQHHDVSELRAKVREIIGVFKPRIVDMSTYRMMLLHPMVHFGLAIRRSAIINLPWTVESDNPEIKAGALKHFGDIFRPFATAASNAIGVGHVVMGKKIVTEQFVIDVEATPGSKGKDGKPIQTKEVTLPMAWMYKKFKNIDTDTITFLIEDDEVVGVKQKAGHDDTSVGMDRAFIWSYRKEDVFGDPRGFASLKVPYTPWYDNMAMTMFGNRYFERKGEGVWKGRAPREVIQKDGKKLDGFKIMSLALAALRSGSVFTLPAIKDEAFRDFLFDVELMSDEKRGDMFQNRIDSTDLQVLRGLLITDKAATSGDGEGSMAQAQVHAETMEPMLMSDAQEFLTEMNSQVVDPWVDFNWGEDERLRSRTKITTKGIARSTLEVFQHITEKVMEGEEILESGKTVKVKDLIDMKSVLRQLGVPLKSPEELAAIAEQIAVRLKEMQDNFRGVGGGKAQEDEDIDDKETANVLTKKGVLEEDE